MVDHFGGEEVKQRYLQRLTSMELLAAYCLTEPGSAFSLYAFSFLLFYSISSHLLFYSMCCLYPKSETGNLFAKAFSDNLKNHENNFLKARDRDFRYYLVYFSYPKYALVLGIASWSILQLIVLLNYALTLGFSNVV